MIPQHLQALADANRIRMQGVRVKRDIAAGRLTIAAALDDPRAERIQIGDLLEAQRRWGAVKVNQALEALCISWHRQVRALTERQRHALVAHLDHRPVIDPYRKDLAA